MVLGDAMPEWIVAAKPFLPLALGVILGSWGAWMTKACKFQMPASPRWPFAENPGLAMELADSDGFVDAVLGNPGTNLGIDNRKAATLLQKLDFVFIPLYTVFFAAAALTLGG